MTSILERIAQSRSRFRPTTYEDFFALQLAKALKDTAHLREYAALASCYPEGVLLKAYRLASAGPPGDPALKRFEEALGSIK